MVRNIYPATLKEETDDILMKIEEFSKSGYQVAFNNWKDERMALVEERGKVSFQSQFGLPMGVEPS